MKLLAKRAGKFAAQERRSDQPKQDTNSDESCDDPDRKFTCARMTDSVDRALPDVVKIQRHSNERA